MANYPEVGEFVIGTVKKIIPYGAFVGLDEYAGVEAFIHISQVSTGWVRSIREHLREGQKIVAKIHVIDAAKGQIDLSLKQVSEADKRRKLEAYQGEKKARKIIEHAGGKLKKAPALSWTEAGGPLLAAFGSLSAALEALREGDNKAKLSPQWVDGLKEILEKEFKPKVIKIRAKLELKFLSSDGVAKLRNTLALVEKAGQGKAVIKIRYLGAPSYFMDIESADHKLALKALERTESLLGEAAKAGDCEYSLEPQK